jgi:hypothetical protein
VSSKVWAYGVTTVASRLSSGLLSRTLTSLSKAGFPEPRLFMDGLPSETLPAFAANLQVTCRNPAIKIYGNFHLGLSELFIRNAHADFYAMFQDDFVTYLNLREYLEACKFPAKGYLNLYTFPENEKPIKGWYQSNQLGKGAVALVFNNDGARALLNSSYWINRPASVPKNPQRLWKFVDGGVVESMRKAGFKEYVHNPSLVQHTGDRSTLGNGRQAKASTFLGEDVDAMTLLNPSQRRIATKTISRIGLVGYNTASGLGEVNRQIAEYIDIYRWLVKPHKSQQNLPFPDNVDCEVCPGGERVEEFVKSVDAVVFAEVPLYENLISLCKTHGKLLICIPMLEWMPPGGQGWPKEIDLFICPTRQCYNEFSHVLPCVHFPWPVDTEKFEFKQRDICKQFVFINGHGGYAGRKGGAVIKAALELWPEMPLIVYDQTGSFPNSKVTKSNTDLYSQGDVLISPHSVDGIGLELMEAMACGMPVISTDGEPWSEIPAIARIRASVGRKSIRRPVDWYTPDPAHLVSICKELLGQDISTESQEARKWAESQNWDKSHVDSFERLIKDCVKKEIVLPPQIIPEQPKPIVTGKSRWDKFLFNEAVAALKQIGGKVIVELGAIRDTKPIAKRADGWSTVEWAKTGLEVHCIDNDPKALEAAKALVPSGAIFYCCDGFEFLSKFNKEIDLLYLDGPDANKGGQQFHLAALLAAKMSDHGLILMDDCDLWPGRWKGRGKGELAIPKALEMGYKIIADNSRQVLLQRCKDA